MFKSQHRDVNNMPCGGLEHLWIFTEAPKIGSFENRLRSKRLTINFSGLC